jgi:hypothetical protein
MGRPEQPANRRMVDAIVNAPIGKPLNLTGATEIGPQLFVASPERKRAILSLAASHR